MRPRAAGIMFVHDGHVFLGKRGPDGDAPGTWAFPGGKIERGESPESAARRELHEEMGVAYRGPLHHLGTTSDGFAAFGAAPGRKFSADDEAVDAREHTDTGWFPFDKLPEPLHPGIKELSKMPLETGKSKAAFSHNVKTEVVAGKPQKQAVAIAYREAGEKQAKDAHPSIAALHKLAEDCMGYDKHRK
jgi:8-oxo-dGTP pyrophosphatase MutT (NUDIX family)